MKKLRRLFKRKSVVLEYNPAYCRKEQLLDAARVTRTKVFLVPSTYQGPNREAFRLVKI